MQGHKNDFMKRILRGLFQVGSIVHLGTIPSKSPSYGNRMSENQSVDSKEQPLHSATEQRRRWAFGCLIVGLLALLYVSGSLTGVLAGYQVAERALSASETLLAVQDLTEMFILGQQDFAAGRYEIARQRFEYILSHSPGFPGAAEQLAQVLLVLYATATPTPVPPTATTSPTPTQTASATLTPTPDLRPVQEMLASALSAFQQEDWNKTIEIIAALRNVNPTFAVTQLDGMLFMALRNRGVQRIFGKDLEGGSYDLSLAEKFGPLDAEAGRARELARLYMYGSAFWEAYPAQAVFYFGQVAAAAPYLTDASGWTARQRYRAVLIQYGDQLANNDQWCEAEEQYRLAASIYTSSELETAIDQAAEGCSPATKTPTRTSEPSDIPTEAASETPLPASPTPSPTSPPGATPTQTQPVETPSPPTATNTPSPTGFPTEVPATETPTEPEETPSPSPTEAEATATDTSAPTEIPPSETPTPTLEALPTQEPATQAPSTEAPTQAMIETPVDTATP
jgi:hypothetical protein